MKFSKEVWLKETERITLKQNCWEWHNFHLSCKKDGNHTIKGLLTFCDSPTKKMLSRKEIELAILKHNSSLHKLQLGMDDLFGKEEDEAVIKLP